MIVIISVILFIFILAFTGAWIWYFKNEMASGTDFYEKALVAYAKSNLERAKNLFLKAIKNDPKNKDAHLKLGLIYFQGKDYSNAKEAFENTLKLDPKDFDALFNLGYTLQIQNQISDAIEKYKQAIAVNEKSVECYTKLGLLIFQQNDFEEGLNIFTKALELSPDNSFIHFYKIRCLDELCGFDTIEQGKAIIDEYLQLAGKKDLPSEYQSVLTKAYAKNGQLDEAIESCQKTLTNNPEDAECYRLFGLMQLLKKDLNGAKSSLATALNLHGDNDKVHEILSYTLCQQKNKCAVKKCREKYMELIQKFSK